MIRKCVDEEKESVSICYSDNCTYLNSFLTIWVDDNEAGISSPFKDIEDVELFADIIIKLLNVVIK